MKYADWDDAEVTRMVDMFKQGSPNSKVARALNHEFHNNEPMRTRNAVIGKLHRMGYRRDNAAAFNGETQRQSNRIAVRCRKEKEIKRKADTSPVKAKPIDRDRAVIVPVPDLSSLPIATGETLIQLSRYSCKAVSGRNEHNEATYCGARTDGGSWCAHHKAAYMVKPVNKDKNVFRQYRRYV